jgi:ADP-dependent NAD(P)H-hydrate dehydratase
MTRPVSPTMIDAALLRTWPLPSFETSQDKDDRGRVLVVAGSPQVPGAALLAGEAALRAGAGKLQVGAPAEVAVALAIALPEAKVMPLPTTLAGACKFTPALEQACARTDALLIGPGMEDTPTLRRLVHRLSGSAKCTVVADAGALEAFGQPHAFTSTPVLTPHAGEMASLIDANVEEVRDHAGEIALRFASQRGVVLVLKGPQTWIASPDGRTWLHTGGCSGLGTSGSGDVLGGIIAGLIARGAEPEQAAAWGVYLHGQAGEVLSRSVGSVGFLARELPSRIPALLDSLAPQGHDRQSRDG